MIPVNSLPATAIVAAALAAGLGAPLAAADINVPGDVPTIAIAIAQAADGDVIVLAPGLYPTTVDLGTKDISIVGSGGPDVTAIDAFGLGNVIRVTGGQSDVLIEGVTLRGGDAVRGAGLFVNGASVTVRDCRFIDNEALSAGGDGGGLFIETGSLVLEDSVFIGNRSDDVGGAVYLRTGVDADIRNCTFEGNESNTNGGALATNGTTAVIADCSFVGNTAIAEDGGAIWSFDSALLFERCRIADNECGDDGSALIAQNGSSVTLRNSLVTGNTTLSNGTIYAWDSGTTVTMLQCTVAGNEGAGNAGLREFDGGNIVFRNGILTDNVGSSEVDASVSVTWSAVVGVAGAGNIAQDPMLDADFRPMADSPVIDAADSSLVVAAEPVDFAGDPRVTDDPDSPDTGSTIFGLTVDMGAFEFQPVGGGGPVDPCPADITNDQSVDFNDLLALLAAWGDCP